MPFRPRRSVYVEKKEKKPEVAGPEEKWGRCPSCRSADSYSNLTLRCKNKSCDYIPPFVICCANCRTNKCNGTMVGGAFFCSTCRPGHAVPHDPNFPSLIHKTTI